jgi:lipoprotein-anchoring transpeptidase ErfK/SrfK
MKKLILLSLLITLNVMVINCCQITYVHATGLENQIEKNNNKDNEGIVSESTSTEINEPIVCNEMLNRELKNLIIFNKYGKELKIGSKGEIVKSLHIVLKWLNYDVDDESSIYNEETQKAIIKFQKDHSMKEIGVVDKLTYIRLNDYIHYSKIKYDFIDYNVKIGATEDYWIIINKTTNILQLYKGKNRLKIYPIATGRYPSFTPEGKFEISNKMINAGWKHIPGGVATNPLGSRWMGLSVKNHYTYGIHGCGRPESIGTYASAGCIRMYNFQSEELYNIVSVHTPVWIGTTDKIDKWINELNEIYDIDKEKQLQKQKEITQKEKIEKEKKEEEELRQEEKLKQENTYKEIIANMLEPYIDKALIEYYGEEILKTTRTFDNIKIDELQERKYMVILDVNIWIKDEVDIPIGKERIKFSIEQGQVNIEEHEHIGFEKVLN